MSNKTFKQIVNLGAVTALSASLFACNSGVGGTPNSMNSTDSTNNLTNKFNGNNNASSNMSSSTAPVIYTTKSTWYGDLGGVSGADKKCQDDSQCPPGASCKAIIGASTRDKNKNWILQPNMDYNLITNNNSQIIRTNDQAVFGSSINLGSNNAWSGLNKDWVAGYYPNCKDWTFGDSHTVSTADGTINFTDGQRKCSKYDDKNENMPTCSDSHHCNTRPIYCAQWGR